MSSGFSNSGEDAIQRQLITDSRLLSGHGHREETLDENYEIPRIISWIKDLRVSKVALQFPDQLLVDAPDVALQIEHACMIDVYILGDTSYGSCCVDETSALHIEAEAVVHFGQACLSQNKRLPVLYIFENLTVESEPFLKAFKSTFLLEHNILIASDFSYHQSTKYLVSQLSKLYNVIHLEPDFPSEAGSLSENSTNVDLSRVILKVSGRRCSLPPDNQTIENWIVCYIGEESVTLTNLMLTLNRCSVFTYNPKNLKLRKETLDVNQQLRKRYYLIEKAKDAQLIGILVSTLGVADYLEMIDRIKLLITNAGKKFYTFVVGKLNPSKLANFPEIDCYTIIACPENSLLDAKEFYRPVVTPFELEVALNSARSWTGDYITDFRQLLPGASGYVELQSSTGDLQTDVSLVSGRMRNLGLGDENSASRDDASDQQVLGAGFQGSLMNKLPSGSDFLSQRGWSGLEPRVGETPVPSMARSGRRGLAAGYSDEGVTFDQRGKPDGQE